MKLLIQKLLVHLIILSVTIILTFYLSMSEYSFLYTDHFKDKIKLLSQRKRNSIILFGGSSMAFGVDSKMLSDSTGLPVINIGLQGSLGMTIPLHYVSKYLKSGDIILFAPEYDQYQNENYLGEGKTPARVILHADPKFLSQASFKELKKIIPYSFSTIIEKLKIKLINNFESRKSKISFNEFGDFVYHLDKKNRFISNQILNTQIGSNLNQECISYVTNINEQIKKRNGLILISFPPILTQVGINNFNTINEISNALKQTKIPVISNPENYFFEQNFLFEGASHLNNEGRQIRTKKLIKDIKYFLKDLQYVK